MCIGAASQTALVAPNNPVVGPNWTSGNRCSASRGPDALIPIASNNYAEWIRPLLWLSNSCSAGSIAHEFFPLAGFMHEHQRTFLGKYKTRPATSDMDRMEFKTIKLADHAPVPSVATQLAMALP